jgi:hypothetical protein
MPPAYSTLPTLHQFAPFGKGVRSPVRLLGLVSHKVRERCLRDLSRKVGLIARPVAECALSAAVEDFMDAIAATRGGSANLG